MRKFGRYLACAALALLAAIGAWAAVNLADEDLHPQAREWLAWRAEPLPAADNGYYAALGFATDADDIHAAGLRIAEAHERAVAGGGRFDNGARAAVGAAQGAFSVDKTAVCDLGAAGDEPECLKHAAAHRAAVEGALAQHRALLARYEALRAYPRFQLPIAPTLESPFPPWSRVFAAKRLRHAQIALAFLDGGRARAFAAAAEELAFWRRVLAEPDIALFDKMAAQAAVRGSVLLASELLRADASAAPERERLVAALRPLSERERSIAGPLAHEFRMIARLVLSASGEELARDAGGTAARGLRRLAWCAAAPWFKRRATLNLIHGDFAAVLRADAAPAAQFPALREAIEERYARGRFDSFGAYVYNPVGRRLLEIGAADYTPYIERLRELDELLRRLAGQ